MMECNVRVLPDNISIACPPGTTLMEAVSDLGIHVEAPCGGKGFCGKCRAQLVSGRENAQAQGGSRISVADALAGWVLLCQTTVSGDVEVYIPEVARLSGQKILTAGSARRVALDSSVCKYAVTVVEASIAEPRSDWDRLIDALVAAGAPVSRQATGSPARALPLLLRGSAGAVTAVVDGGLVVDVEPGDTASALYGVAFDIGTTTVVGYLVDLRSGRDAGVASRMNPQVIYGDDVISRINMTIEETDGLAKLQAKAVGAMVEILEELSEGAQVQSDSIYQVVVAGNTSMAHFLAGIPPKHLGLYPYTAALSGPLDLSPRDIGLHGVNPAARVRLLPNVASFVGADTVGVMLAVEADSFVAPTLVIDIGTNGEIVMARDGKVWTASCAAGPAFEGGHLSCGMRATEGAIDRVSLGMSGDMDIHTIGEAAVKGLCGSGLIDALAEFIRLGIVDATGRMVSPDDLPQRVSAQVRQRLVKGEKGTRFIFASAGESATGDEVCVTQKDIRELQLIKAAIAAGCKVLMDISGTSVADLDAILLAGAFGNYIDRANALHIGLIPAVSVGKVASVGNAAGAGARIALRSDAEFRRAVKLSEQAIFIELANRPDFQDEYVDAMFFANAAD